MLVSVKSLRKLVNLENITANDIALKLTFAGIEVEEIITLASGTNLVIGHILECAEHPDSDHLHVLKVDLGNKYGIEQIVCGAPNARKGLKVIVARVGANLPGGSINKGVIRGVESNGMCCSLLELGVANKYLSEQQTKGIEELPDDAPVGEEDVLSYLGLDDQILNIKVLANRPDLLSLINVAREVASLFERELTLPEINYLETFKTNLTVGSQSEKCSQFSGKEIRNIVIKESPKWMKEYLLAMGVRSINNIVDIGNYVMLQTGQPLHMYDADKLAKAELIARDDLEVDFVALDEKTYKTQKGDLLICCDGEAMCLGGVMGAQKCAVDENTKNIYIEAASFDAATIRRTSNRLGLGSESSTRFIKGTNHFQSEYVLNYAAQLVKELCEGQQFSNNVVYQSEEQKDVVVKTSLYKINNRLGTNFTLEETKAVLERLHFTVKVNDEELEVIAPTFRIDISCDADISEEVVRVLGFDNVVSTLPKLDTKLGALTDAQLKEKLIRDYLLWNGLDECLTYSLISKKEITALNLANNDEPYKILNPLTEEHEYFRKNVVYSLLMSVSYNVARQNKDLAMFEVSNIDTVNAHEKHLAIVLCGNQNRQSLLDSTPYNFYHMKGLFEGICALLGVEPTRYRLERIKDHKDELHPGKAVDVIVNNKVIGSFGVLHPNKVKEYDFGKNEVIVLELVLDTLIDMKVGAVKNKPISKFPLVNRDLALVVDKTVLAKDLIKSIKQVGKGIVKNAEIFDVYEGDNIEASKKSVAITISYGSDDHTLLEKEVNDVEEKIKFELTKVYKAALRG